MRISYAQASVLMQYKEDHWFEALACRWELDKLDPSAYMVRCLVKWWVFILAYVPTLIITVVSYIWDGGLKTLELPMRSIGAWLIQNMDRGYEYAKQLYEGGDFDESV